VFRKLSYQYHLLHRASWLYILSATSHTKYSQTSSRIPTRKLPTWDQLDAQKRQLSILCFHHTSCLVETSEFAGTVEDHSHQTKAVCSHGSITCQIMVCLPPPCSVD